MECKDRNDAPGRRRSERINRNIVECKGTNKENIDSLVRVLIETSWNVKDAVTAGSFPAFFCINRNIVECKD